MDAINSLKHDVSAMNGAIMSLHHEVRSIVLEKGNQHGSSQRPPPLPPDTKGSPMSVSPVNRFHTSPLTRTRTANAQYAEQKPPSPSHTPQDVTEAAHIYEQHEETTAGDLVQGSVKTEHSTGAHNLFRWKSVQKLMEGRKPLGENFVLEHEERKGLLHLYGRGQGIDTWDGGSSTGSDSPASNYSEESGSHGQTPPGSVPPETWGISMGRPNMPDGKFYGGQAEHPGGLNADGTLKLDGMTVYRLEQSYLENMHLLHPFLDKSRLRRMIDRVLGIASQGSNGTATGTAATIFATAANAPAARSPHLLHNTTNAPARNRKRKHSIHEAMSAGALATAAAYESVAAADPSGAVRIMSVAQPLEPRISTAIVLLVLALGKICEHHIELPAPVPEVRDKAANAVQASHTPSPSTAANSPAGPNAERTAAYRRSSELAPGLRPGDRNIDVVPGLAYFTKAAEILGGLQGNDLLHVQANLLAGLYLSQMACVIESWTWIQHACRGLHFLLRDPKLGGVRSKKRRELIMFAYWTCNQLEGDLLAELDLRPSGIHKIHYADADGEKLGVAKPLMEPPEAGPEEVDMRILYMNQLLLRGMLDEYQSMLYPSSMYKKTPVLSLRQRTICDVMLADWRRTLKPLHQWNDDDDPPARINPARLRAKYYGAKYVIHRPFLWHALDRPDPLLEHEAVVRRYRDWLARPERYALLPEGDETQPAPPLDKVEEAFQTLMSCRMCVEAAKRSTLAFDGIWPHKRLIVTNIFGTAHA